MEIDNGLEQLYFTTCLVEGQGVDREGVSIAWTGTAFVYNVPVVHPVSGDGDGIVQLLASNKHVLAPDGVQDIGLRLTWVAATSDDQPDFGEAFTVSFALAEVTYIPHPDAGVDVAVILLLPLLPPDGTFPRPFFRALGTELVAEDSVLEELLAFEDLVFVGYPTGIYDRTNVVPVIRRGMSASPITLDYEGQPAFLMDASVWPGSSGSPVLIANHGSYGTRTGGIIAGSRVHLVGVVAAVHVHEELIPIVPAREVGIAANPIGLGIVFRASAIEECADVLLEKAGVRRAEPPKDSASDGVAP